MIVTEQQKKDILRDVKKGVTMRRISFRHRVSRAEIKKIVFGAEYNQQHTTMKRRTQT